MATIELAGVAHWYQPGSWALRPTSLTWKDGGAYALLGPSGCGKTTLLNIVSGLLRPTEGRVLFDGEDVTALPPQRRHIAQVFQFPVVYQAMTVFDNLAFPLRNRRWKEADVARRVAAVAELLELGPQLRVRAGRLGAELRQRLSLGRGLVRTDVAAVLLDEPLTVVDAASRWLLRRKLKQVHQELRVSLIYVTHDQLEALTFADQVVVMTEGEVVQTGTAQDLFESPAHTFVGHFVGSPGMNLLPCVVEEGGAVARVGAARIPLPPRARPPAAAGGVEYRLGIRPEFVEPTTEGAAGAVPVEVVTVQPMGTHTMISARLEGHALWIKRRDDDQASGAGRGWVRFPAERVQLYADQRRVDVTTT
jgi:glycerol transport system ATP-binding protein